MASRSRSYTQLLGLLSFIIIIILLFVTTTMAVRVGVILHKPSAPTLPIFREAPAFRNGDQCGSNDADLIHIAMTLDTNYLRGTMAAVLSLLQHSTCPENLSFHFLSLPHFENDLFSSIKSTFPYLNFKIYQFDPNLVRSKISKSIRQALDQPLNYARIYLADIIPSSVDRIIYLDSDLVVVDDIEKLWHVEMESKVVAAPEYCHANFTHYFTKAFWSDPVLVKVHLGSLPPFLLIFAGDIKAVNHRWNQHGLGGDNFEGKCRTLHPGPISLLHWSGKGKPWLRLDSRKPCIVDHLWAPYDLYRSSRHSLEE